MRVNGCEWLQGLSQLNVATRVHTRRRAANLENACTAAE